MQSKDVARSLARVTLKGLFLLPLFFILYSPWSVFGSGAISSFHCEAARDSCEGRIVQAMVGRLAQSSSLVILSSFFSCAAEEALNGQPTQEVSVSLWSGGGGRE